MKRLAEWYLKMRGWDFTGSVPDIPKFVIAGAPHTSNWDFFLFLAALSHFDLKVSYIGKHTLFRWPFGYFFRRWGGIPVDRRRPGGLVNQVAEAIRAADEMILVMAPEGTRGAAEGWKPGFLRIARTAGVPVVLAAVDGPSKIVDIGPVLDAVEDTEFMDAARCYYSDKNGLKPSGKGPVRLFSEDSS